MSETRQRVLGLIMAVAFAGQCLAPPAEGQGSESAGMITEIKVLRGQVQVQSAGAQEWRKAGPLLALRAGDTVNTTSRIEGLNRELSTAILISGATLAAVKERVLVKDRGAIPVKGRTQPVEVYELVGLAGPSS